MHLHQKQYDAKDQNKTTQSRSHDTEQITYGEKKKLKNATVLTFMKHS